MPSSRPPPPVQTELPTIVKPPESSRSPLSRREEAPTVAAPLAELAASDPGIPAPTEALFGTTQHEPLPEPKSHGTALVLLVAVAALGAGLIGGLMFLRHPRHTGGLDTATLPAPAAPPVSAEPEKPAKHAKKHPDDATADGTAEEPSAAPAHHEPPAAGSAAKEASPAASATSPDAGVTKPERHSNVEATPEPSSTDEADADVPWEKPEWAKPDNEIKIHRGPDEQDDKIVIPPEQ
jgi:hypothetical protein